MKVFGHSGVGKTTLIESLRTGYFSGLFRRSKRGSSATSSSSTSSLKHSNSLGQPSSSSSGGGGFSRSSKNGKLILDFYSHWINKLMCYLAN